MYQNRKKWQKYRYKYKQIRIQEINLEDENGRADEEGYQPDEKVYCGNLVKGNCNGAGEYSDDDDDDEYSDEEEDDKCSDDD